MAQYERLRADIIAAESTGLKPQHFDPLLSPYLHAAGTAAPWGYAAAFVCVALLGVAGCILVGRSGRLAVTPSKAASDEKSTAD